MKFNSANLSYGLNSYAAPTGTNIFNDLKIGVDSAQESFPNANVMYTVRAVMVGSESTLTIDQATSVSSGSAFVAGNAQTETATALGNITSASGTTVAISINAFQNDGFFSVTKQVKVLNGDTPALWAAKARASLSEDSSVTALFTVSGTGASIVITVKPNTVGGVTIYKPNDTVSLTIANGTSVGVTPASSVRTIGNATTGVVLFGGNGKDFEGNAINLSSIYAALVVCENGLVAFQDSSGASTYLYEGKYLQSYDDGLGLGGGQTYVFTSPLSSPSATEITITVLGYATGSAAVAASLSIDPAGSSNTILYTAVAPGVAGNSISIQYNPPLAISAANVDAYTSIGGSGNNISVTPGARARMVVVGAGFSQINGTYLYNGLSYLNNRLTRQWVLDNGYPSTQGALRATISFLGEVGSWGIWYNDVLKYISQTVVYADQPNPEVASQTSQGFVPWAGTVSPGPTVTAGVSSAAQVIAAIAGQRFPGSANGTTYDYAGLVGYTGSGGIVTVPANSLVTAAVTAGRNGAISTLVNGSYTVLAPTFLTGGS